MQYEHPGYRLQELRRLLRVVENGFRNPDGSEPRVVYYPLEKIRALLRERVRDLEQKIRQYPPDHAERRVAPLDTAQRSGE